MKYLFTLRGYGEIEALCPDRNIANLRKIIGDRKTLAKVISILAVEHPNPATIAEKPDCIISMMAKDAIEAIRVSNDITIEALPKKPGGKSARINYAWLCFHALRLGAGWPGALDLPISLIFDMIAADQIYAGVANEKQKLTYQQAMALK